MENVDIEGIDKEKLLWNLWKNSKPALFFIVNKIEPTDYDQIKAKKAVDGYIDCFCGKFIRCDLSGNSVDPSMYDRDNGQGSLNKVVQSLEMPIFNMNKSKQSYTHHEDKFSEAARCGDLETMK